MQPYPGINGQSFVISTTPGAGGVSGGVLTVVNDASHGTFVKNAPEFAGDALQSGNLNAATEANKNSITWLTWRAPDWISGGDYSTVYTGTVQMGGLFVQRGSGAGFKVQSGAKVIIGASGPGAGAFELAFGTADFDGGTTTTFHTASLLNADTVTTAGFNVTGQTASNARAATFIGEGSGEGIKAQPGSSQITAVWAHNGVVSVDKNLPTPGTDPGANNLWGTNITKAWGTIETNGSGAVVVGDGHGLTASIVSILGNNYIKITVENAMANTLYAITFGAEAPGSGPIPYPFVEAAIFAKTTTQFCITVGDLTSGAAAMDPATHALTFHLHIDGRQ